MTNPSPHISDTLPKPTRYAKYGGDVRHIVGEHKGPNTLGEFLTAVTAVYDPTGDFTRVGFAYGIHTTRATTP